MRRRYGTTARHRIFHEVNDRPRRDLSRQVNKVLSIFFKHEHMFKFFARIVIEISDMYYFRQLEQKYYIRELSAASERGRQLSAYSPLYEPGEPFYTLTNQEQLHLFYHRVRDYVQRYKFLEFQPPNENPDTPEPRTVIFMPLNVLLWLENAWYEFHSCDPFFSDRFVDISMTDQIFGDHEFRPWTILGP